MSLDTRDDRRICDERRKRKVSYSLPPPRVSSPHRLAAGFETWEATNELEGDGEVEVLVANELQAWSGSGRERDLERPVSSAHSQETWRPPPMTPDLDEGVRSNIPIEAGMRAPSLIVAELRQVEDAERLRRLLDCLVHDCSQALIRGVGEGTSRSAGTWGLRYDGKRSRAGRCDEKRAARD